MHSHGEGTLRGQKKQNEVSRKLSRGVVILDKKQKKGEWVAADSVFEGGFLWNSKNGKTGKTSGEAKRKTKRKGNAGKTAEKTKERNEEVVSGNSQQ